MRTAVMVLFLKNYDYDRNPYKMIAV